MNLTLAHPSDRGGAHVRAPVFQAVADKGHFRHLAVDEQLGASLDAA